MAATQLSKSEIIAHVAKAADVSKKKAANMLEALNDLAHRSGPKGLQATAHVFGRPAGPISPLKVLHDPVSGRVDAERVARYLNEPLTFIANALQRKYSTVTKTPAALSLQPRLFDFKRVIEVLEHVLGDAQSVRIWMNTPHPDLDGMTPRAVAESGNITVIRRMIDSALSGNLT